MIPPVSALLDLAGRACVVTGAAKGIGRGIAERLAEAGARVLVTDIDEAAGEEAARLIRNSGGDAVFMPSDAGRVDEARRIVGACVDRFGAIDLLVNNAGIFPTSTALNTTEDLWNRVMAVNLKGVFFHAQAAAQRMIAAGKGGQIVNIASIDAYHPTGGLVHYDASKAGVVMMTRSLAVELGRHGIRVNAVAPGAIHTPGADVATEQISRAMRMKRDELMQGFVDRIPLGRIGEPDDIARAVLFLASPAAEYITGQTLVVDGGFLVG